MVGQHRKKLPRLHLLPEIDLQFLHFVTEFFCPSAVDECHWPNVALFADAVQKGWCHNVNGCDKIAFRNLPDLRRGKPARQ